MTAATKLTAAQRSLLGRVVSGDIRRDDTGGRYSRPLYTPFDYDTGKTIRTSTMDVLTHAGLVELDFSDRYHPRFRATEAGRKIVGP